MEFLKGETEPVGDCGKFTAGIDVHGADQFPNDSRKRTWYHRVECYGNTTEQAEQLRDKILSLLQPNYPVGAVIGFQRVRNVHHYPTVAWAVEDLPVGTELFVRPAPSADVEVRAQLALATRLLEQALAALNPRGRLASDIRDMIKVKP